MRTKTILLTAAVAAAGLTSSMAQVYSINVVGYVTTVQTTKNLLIANPLATTNDTIQGVLAGAPNGSTFFRWTGTGYASSFKGGAAGTNNGAWIGAAVAFAPGGGGFLQLPGAGPFNHTNTYVGEVLQGALSTPFGSTFSSLISSKVPESGTPEALGLTDDIATAAPATIFRWTGAGYASSFKPGGSSAFLGGPVINIATAFFLQTTNVSSWNRTFTVGP